MEKLYLKGWEYNSYLIINKLAEIIKENGGEFIYDFPYINTYNKKSIVNRSIIENIAECQGYLNNKTDAEIKANKLLTIKQKELKELQKIKNDPITVNFTNYINFVLNNNIYYIQLQDNPFFDDYIQKEKAEQEGNQYIVKYNYYMEKLNKKWIEEFEGIKSFYATLTDEQISELAKRLYNQIINNKFSDIVTTKKRCCNYYDNRYHYEYIKEKKEKKYKIINIL